MCVCGGREVVVAGLYGELLRDFFFQFCNPNGSSLTNKYLNLHTEPEFVTLYLNTTPNSTIFS